MAGSVTNKQQVLPVPAGTEVPAASITGTGDPGLDGTVAPYTLLKDQSNPAGAVPLLGMAQDGTDSAAATATQATGGVGIRGWLSTLVSLFRSGAATVQVGSLPPVQSAAAALSSVPASTTSVQLVTVNAARKGLLLVNDSTSACYVAYAPVASASAYTVCVPGGSGGTPFAWEMPLPVYTGAISALWLSATGAMRLTELT